MYCSTYVSSSIMLIFIHDIVPHVNIYLKIFKSIEKYHDGHICTYIATTKYFS